MKQNYPSHKTLSIVKRYVPLIHQALEAYPEVCEFAPAEDVAYSTFVARFRDSIKALQEYTYEGAELQMHQREKLEQLSTRAVGGKLLVGTKVNLREYKVSEAGQLARADVAGLVHTVNEPTQALLEAMFTCMENGVFESINITGLSAKAVQDVLPEVSITNLGKELVLYV